MTNSPDLNVTVMLVDDEACIREVFKSILSYAGFKVCCCKDGQEAYERVAGGHVNPDVFIIDVTMPRMNGYELVCALRKLGFRQPVILWWSLDVPTCRLRELGEPVPMVIRLPVDSDTIIDAVRQAMKTA